MKFAKDLTGQGPLRSDRKLGILPAGSAILDTVSLKLKSSRPAFLFIFHLRLASNFRRLFLCRLETTCQKIRRRIMSTAKGVSLKLTPQPEIITWPETHYVFLEKIGPFQNTAAQPGRAPAIVPRIAEHNKIRVS